MSDRNSTEPSASPFPPRLCENQTSAAREAGTRPAGLHHPSPSLLFSTRHPAREILAQALRARGRACGVPARLAVQHEREAPHHRLQFAIGNNQAGIARVNLCRDIGRQGRRSFEELSHSVRCLGQSIEIADTMAPRLSLWPFRHLGADRPLAAYLAP